MGLYGVVFALCWAAVPFYKLYCQHFGLEGDLTQKDYSLTAKSIDKSTMIRSHNRGRSS